MWKLFFFIVAKSIHLLKIFKKRIPVLYIFGRGGGGFVFCDGMVDMSSYKTNWGKNKLSLFLTKSKLRWRPPLDSYVLCKRRIIAVYINTSLTLQHDWTCSKTSMRQTVKHSQRSKNLVLNFMARNSHRGTDPWTLSTECAEIYGRLL